VPAATIIDGTAIAAALRARVAAEAAALKRERGVTPGPAADSLPPRTLRQSSGSEPSALCHNRTRRIAASLRMALQRIGQR
jgi:hypothetical protein